MTEWDHKLDGVFDAYRDSVRIPEASSGFMPELWSRIESRRNFATRLTRMTQFFAVSAAAMGLICAAVLVLPNSAQANMSETYIDILADAHPTENLLAQGIAHIDVKEGRR